MNNPSFRAADLALLKLQQRVHANAREAVALVGANLKAEIVRKLSTQGTGRYYAKASQVAGASAGPMSKEERAALRKRRQKARALNVRRRAVATALNAGAIEFGSITKKPILTGLHRASAPGEPPAPDTGTLRRSAFIERTDRGVRVGVAMPYAAALEFGTTRAGRDRKTVILPRPFLRPALAQIRTTLGPVFTESIKRAATRVP